MAGAPLAERIRSVGGKPAILYEQVKEERNVCEDLP
jgi:ribosomal protein L25 (general stress protein Ctc)